MKNKYLALILAIVVGTTTLSSCYWGRYHDGYHHHHDGYYRH
ncbi:MAG TPA: hypothetical protein VK718_03245 [Ferruginibacter sp.]|nr:hypothetical protein [Ferruginibacter sp.]